MGARHPPQRSGDGLWCDRTLLLDLVENFTLFSEYKSGLVKIIGQNHQFLGVNNAIASMLAIRGRTAGLRPAAVLPRLEVLDNPTRPDKKNTLRLTEPRSTVSPNGLGVFRHTQGSDEMF